MTAPTPTERLTAASKRLRGLAEATGGEWYSAAAWATTAPFNLPIEPADAAYIAAMHPAVALAVADWLALVGRLLGGGFDANAETRAALAVADAIGGRE